MNDYAAFRSLPVAPGLSAADVLAVRHIDPDIDTLTRELWSRVGPVTVWSSAWGICVRIQKIAPRMSFVEKQVYRHSSLRLALAHMLACILHERRPVKVSA